MTQSERAVIVTHHSFHLIQALKRGRMSGTGLDVFEAEPLPADSPLRNLDNVTLTSVSEDAVPYLQVKAADVVVSDRS